jgi:signal transduction histidine kinase
MWALVALALYGPGWAIAAAAVGTLPTLGYWGHPYGALLFVLEVAAVCLITWKRRFGITSAMLLYWITAGLPLVWLCYKFVLAAPDSSIRFVMFKMGINGMGNAVSASLIIMLVTLLKQQNKNTLYQRVLGPSAKPLPPLKMSEHLSHIMIAVLLVVTVTQMSLHSKKMMSKEEDAAVSRLVGAVRLVDYYSGSSQAPLSREEMMSRLIANMPDLRFRLIDPRTGVIPEEAGQTDPLPPYLTGEAEASQIKLLEQNVHLWSPPLASITRIKQRMESVFFIDKIWKGQDTLRITAELPAGQIWNTIYSDLSKDLGIAFFLLALASFVITPVCWRLTRPLAELSELSGKMASSMGGSFRPQWPESPIAEINTLTDAFARMSSDLNSQFTSILESTREGMLLCTRDGTILFTNSRLRYFFGKESVQAGTVDKLFLVMKGLEAALARELREQITVFLQDERQESAFQRNFAYTIGSHRFHYSVYATFIEKTGDSPEGLRLLVFRDRTEEEEREVLKEEMISQISHELRTPLTSILGFSEILCNRELSPARQRSYTNTIYNEAVRLSRLVDDFLDLQRMESGDQPYYLVPLDLCEIAGQVAEQWRLDSTRELQLAIPGEPAIVMADADRIRQVLHNLVGNAFKYSPEQTQVILSVTQSNGMVRIEVDDRGLGIPEADKDKIFRKFYRVEHPDRRKIPGSGLGLTIVKEIVDAHQGQITFSSQHGEGSVFTVWLPLHRAPETADMCLLIERNDHYADTVAAAMEQHGHNVLRLGSFEEALYAIGSGPAHRPRMIAANLIASGLMNGLEFASRLLAQDTGKPTLLIFLETLETGSKRTSRPDFLQTSRPFSARQVAALAQSALGSSGARCYFPLQDAGILKAQLAKFGLHPLELREEKDALAAIFPGGLEDGLGI